MSNDPILAVAVRAARRAGSVIVDAARDLKRLPSHAKDHGDIATEADAEAENAIIATLRAAFPDHAIVGKEAGETPATAPAAAADGYRWIVDPIDGTVNFVHGFPYYAVSIALTHGQEITHAVVLDPMHDELFTAINGKGAQLNGTPIRTSTCVRARGRAGRHRVSGARQPAAWPAYLPVLQRAGAAVRRHPPRRRLRARPRATSPRAASTASGRSSLNAVGRRGRRAARRAKPAAASATSPAAAISCARTK